MEITKFTKAAILLLRVAIGWLFIYDGIIKLQDKAWSAHDFLVGTKFFPAFYQWLASPEILSIVNMITPWALIILGAAILTGLYVRIVTIIAMTMMVLFYIPILTFPTVTTGGYLVDKTVIYFLVLLTLNTLDAGRYFGLDASR